MELSAAHKTIIHAIIQKAEKVCPGSLALIGVYGSVCTGDIHEKSDLDLLLLINDENGYKLATGFILDDTQIGYDIYCTTWPMLEAEAACPHAQLAKLLDSEIVYVADMTAVQRLNSLQKNALHILSSDLRYAKAAAQLSEAKQAYADAMMALDIADLRQAAANVIWHVANAVMLQNGRYFQKGVKRMFEELSQGREPMDLRENVLAAVRGNSCDEIKHSLTLLLRSAVIFVFKPCTKQSPSADNMGGTYEEMFSNWYNKAVEAEKQQDDFASFMALAGLGNMLHSLAEHVDFTPYDVMRDYIPGENDHNITAFLCALASYQNNYLKANISPRRYADAESFASDYLNM